MKCGYCASRGLPVGGGGHRARCPANARIRRMVEEGVEAQDMADELGLSKDAVHQRVHRLGLSKPRETIRAAESR